MASIWSTFPFLRIVLAFVSGISAAHYGEEMSCVAGALLGLFLFVYIFCVVITPQTAFHRRSPWVGLLGLGCIFLTGYLRLLTSKACHDANHLRQWAAVIEAYEATALEDPHSKGTSSRVIVAVRRARVQGKWRQVYGKVQIIFPKLPGVKLFYGNVLLIQGNPQPVPAPRNPYEFDYAAFLGLSQIYHQHFVEEEKIMVIAEQPPNPIKALSFKVLRRCKFLLEQHISHREVCSVVLALVLGHKDELDPRVRDAYLGAGTMHVLAVSGLHVGILYWLLSVLLGLLKKSRYSKWLSPALSLVTLWFYAFVTGLSPSALRATLMFTFFTLAKILDRQSNSYNTLAASAFLLLFWDPLLVFSVSFQLSYLAVLGIVYLQPKVYRSLVLEHNPFLDKLWLLASVSLAAQVTTTPVSLYYFHQFPTYFLIANWLVVPAALLILCLGFGILMTSFWPGLSTLIAWVLEQVVLGINQFVFAIQSLPFSLFANINLSASTVLLLYGLLITLLTFLHTRRLKYWVVTNALVILLSLRSIQVYLRQQAQCKVIFYSIDHHKVTAFVKGHQSTLCVDSSFKENPKKYNYHVQPSQGAMGIMSLISYTLDEAVQQQGFPLQAWQGLKLAIWQGKRFFFIDKNTKKLPSLKEKVYTDFLVVEENAVTTLQPLLDRFEFDTLVIGASNKRSLAEQLQAEAEQGGLHSHSLLQQGALTIAW